MGAHVPNPHGLLAVPGRGFERASRGGGGGREALDGKGPQRRPQKRLVRRLEEVAQAVGGGYC